MKGHGKNFLETFCRKSVVVHGEFEVREREMCGRGKSEFPSFRKRSRS